MLRVLALAIVLALIAAGPASARPAVTVHDGVLYGKARVGSGSGRLLLDLYAPTRRSKRPRAVVVLVHGGGFTQQSRKDAAIVRMARGLAAKGIVAASIDYRLMGTQPVPSTRVAPLLAALPNGPKSKAIAAAADDTLTAIDYLRDHAKRLGIDANRLGLIGSSAGGVTVDQVGYALDDHGIKAPNARFVASLWGGILVHTPAGLGSQTAAQLERGEPALFAVHGDADPTVPVLLDDQLVARARDQHVPVEYHRIPGGRHGFVGTEFFTRKVAGAQTSFDRLLAFAEKRLR
jgi:acetyl esterase/lipase